MELPFLVKTPGCGTKCRYAWMGHTDAAKRVSDAMTLAYEVGGWDSCGKWMSFSLNDGTSTHDLYDTKQQAVRGVPDEFNFMFLKTHPGGMSPCEAEIMLSMYRNSYKAGFRLADPDAKSGGPDIIPRIGFENAANQVNALRKRGN